MKAFIPTEKQRTLSSVKALLPDMGLRFTVGKGRTAEVACNESVVHYREISHIDEWLPFGKRNLNDCFRGVNSEVAMSQFDP